MDEETKASMSLPRCGLPDIQRKGRHGYWGKSIWKIYFFWMFSLTCHSSNFTHRLCWQNDLKTLNGTESIFGRFVSFLIIKIGRKGLLTDWVSPKKVVPLFRALFLWSIFIFEQLKGNNILINPGGGVVVTNGPRRLWHSQCCGTQGRCPPQM